MQTALDAVLVFCASFECTSRILSELVNIYKTSIYSYNTAIKRYGIYLKPVHIVVKKSFDSVKIYHYYARYWYKVVYRGGKLKWIYLGREKPLETLPNPPLNPFVAIKVVNNENNRACVYVDSADIIPKLNVYLDEVLSKVKCTDVIMSNTLGLKLS